MKKSIKNAIIKNNKPAKYKNSSNIKNKVITGVLAFVMALSAGGILTACKNTPEPAPKPPIIIETPDEDKEALVAAIANQTIFNKKVEDSTSATIEYNGSKYEIDGNKLKVTNADGVKIYELDGDNKFVYLQEEAGWSKNKTESETSAIASFAELEAFLQNIDLEKVENNQVYGKFDDKTIIYKTDSTNSQIEITIDGKTLVVNKLDGTQVTPPSEYQDNTQDKPVIEQFDPNNSAHIAKLEENLAQTLEFIYANVTMPDTEITNLQKISLMKSVDSNLVDTIGIVFNYNYGGGDFLKFSTITLPVQKDLTYQQLFTEKLVYGNGGLNVNKVKINTIYSNSVDRERETKYAELADIISKQMLGNDYKAANWYGWKLNDSGLTDDSHSVIMLKDNQIRDIKIFVKNNNRNYGWLEAVQKNFEGKEESETTYTIRKDETIEIQGETLNLAKLREQSKKVEQII